MLDRYFLTVPALRKLNQLNAGTEGKRLELVTKAKRNCIAYEEPVVGPIKKRGRPRKKGDTVYLWKQFRASLKTCYKYMVQWIQKVSGGNGGCSWDSLIWKTGWAG